MKRIHVVAGALLLGSSALAWAADTDKSSTLAKAALIGAESAKLAADAVAKAEIEAAMHETNFAQARLDAATKVEFAALDKSLEPLAKAEAQALAWTDKPAAVETGMGGPLEEVDLTPRVSPDNYPPCDPGPGDDRCIQLYEPGVRAQLASWNRPTGGLADGSAVAMGGPFEPADSADAAADATVDVKADKPVMGADKIKTVVVEPEPAVTTHSELQGVGGPVEAQSGYPPCSPGPGDDRCIQLYEPGVTGAGN